MKYLILTTLAVLPALSACDKTAQAPTSANLTAPAVAQTTGKWIETVSKTADGGMVMGNPTARVKLVEYGAMTCSHCAEFTAAATPEMRLMIANGNLSYEFRPFLLNAMDVPASLLARCGGAGPFFPIAEQMFATQATWLGKTKEITEADQKLFATMPPSQQTVFLAEKLGLIEFVQARGIGSEAAKACLTDAAAIEELGKISEVAQQKFKVAGTPTFVINGQTVPATTQWEALKPKLTAAGA